MRLIKLKFKDFRRFAGEQSLDLSEDIIALVGPNEAGKSSILRALELVGDMKAPAPTDTTRGLTGPATLSALFVLDQDDRALLTKVHQGSLVTHLWIDLIAGREASTWRPEPRPRRDLTGRQRCRELLERLDGDPGLNATYSADDTLPWDSELFDEVKKTLASSAETLSADAVSSLEAVAHRLDTIQYPPLDSDDDTPKPSAATRRHGKARDSAAAGLMGQVATERAPTPTRQVITALEDRTPSIAFFREDDRQLNSSYNLDEVAENPSVALDNLCALADLDLDEVRASLAEGRTPHVEKLFETANLLLRQRFRETWSQSDVYPRLGTPLDGQLRVMVAADGGGDYTFPEERSDGLRWFMALHAFLARHGKEEPILLVDEAETHLHYDAQADLIDALMRQRIASKVIYTTHSIGCMPPDLGCGVRVALAEADSERSRIVNSYWSVDTGEEQKVGYTPLLFAMGARLLSFTVPRFGVIVEGPADAILLPSILRRATGLSRLPYRIVPGLSDVAKSGVAQLPNHGGQIATLADGDPGGLDISEMLRRGGLAPNTIFDLGTVRSDCTLEDLVDSSLLADAINDILELWGIGPLRVTADGLPGTGRWQWLVDRGASTNTRIESLSKPRVAQHVVDLSRATEGESIVRPLINLGDRSRLRTLHKRLCAAMGLSTSG